MLFCWYKDIYFYVNTVTTDCRKIVIARKKKYLHHKPASVAQLDARPTGDQEVAGSTPTRSATFFHGDLIMKYFLRSFSPFRCFKKGSCQFLWKECVQYWLTA